MLSKNFLHVSEEFKLLVSLVSNNSCISIIGEVSCPFNICRIIISHCSQVDLALDCGGHMSWFSRDDLVSEGVLQITDLIDSDIPWCSVFVLNLNHWLELVWSSWNECRRLDFARDNFIQLEIFEETPSFSNGDWNDSAFNVVGRDGNSWSLSHEFWLLTFHLVKDLFF